MAKQSNFSGLRYSSLTRKTLNVGGFSGVDYATPTFEVANNRAIDILNFVKKDNVLEKRSGYNHLKHLSDKKINNVWEYNDKYVVNSGGDLLIVSLDFQTIVQKYENQVLNQSVSAFYRNKKLWILGGIKFLVLDQNFFLSNVEDLAEIPTTTIGIVPSNLSNISDTNRESYNAFNNLTYFHTNEFSTGISSQTEGGVDIGKRLEITLDAPFNLKNDADLAKVSLEIQYNSDNSRIISEELKGIDLIPTLGTGNVDINVITLNTDSESDSAHRRDVPYTGTFANPYFWISLLSDSPIVNSDFLKICVTGINRNSNLEEESANPTKYLISELHDSGINSKDQLGTNYWTKSDTEKYTLYLKLPKMTYSQTAKTMDYAERLIQIEYGAIKSPMFRVYSFNYPTMRFATFTITSNGVANNDGNVTINVKRNEYSASATAPTIQIYEIVYSDKAHKNRFGVPYEWDQNYTLTSLRTASFSGGTFSMTWNPTRREVFAYDNIVYDTYPLSSPILTIMRRDKHGE